MTTYLGIAALAVCSAMLGGWLSVKVNAGWPWWIYAFSAFSAGLVWGFIASRSTNLVVNSTIWDTAYTVAFYAILAVLAREGLTPLQWTGVTMSICGTLLLSLGSR